MEAAQVAQHGLIFGAQTFHELRIVQPLIARSFGHVLQDVQASLNGLPAIRRQSLPPRQHVIANV
jgi:pantothenate kinase